MIFLETFTRWIECILVRDTNAKTIIKALNERIFLGRSMPDVFHSDNGTEFKNELVDKFLSNHRVEHTTMPPYHAQANPVERVRRSIKTMIVACLEGKHSDWDLHITEFMFAYNTAVHESTGMAPSSRNMGRNPAPARTFRRRDELAAANDKENVALLNWRERLKQLNHVQDEAPIGSKKAQERQASYYDAKRRDVECEVGDKVWKRNRILSSAPDKVAAKLAPK